MVEGTLFEFYRGDTYSRSFSVSGWGHSIDKIFFTVKENEANKRFCLQKTLDNGITLMDTKEDGTKTYNLFICCTDTDKLKTDVDYSFDVEIHSIVANDTIKKTIITGTLRLKASPTKTCNEC